MNSKSDKRLDGLRQSGLVGYPSPAQVIVPLYRLRDLLLRGNKEIARKYHLTWGEFETLIALRTTPSGQQLTPGDLQELLIFTSGGIAKILSTLQAKGHIFLTTNEDDARSHFAELTPHGRKLIEEALPQLADFNRKRLDPGLTRKEQARLAALLQKLLSSLEVQNSPKGR